MGGLEREDLADFGRAVIERIFERSEKDQVLLSLAKRAYGQDLEGGAERAASIKNPELKKERVWKIEQYSYSQGPEIEKEIEKILAEVVGVEVGGDDDVFGGGGGSQDFVEMIGEGAGVGTAHEELEAELGV